MQIISYPYEYVHSFVFLEWVRDRFLQWIVGCWLLAVVQWRRRLKRCFISILLSFLFNKHTYIFINYSFGALQLARTFDIILGIRLSNACLHPLCIKMYVHISWEFVIRRHHIAVHPPPLVLPDRRGWNSVEVRIMYKNVCYAQVLYYKWM